MKHFDRFMVDGFNFAMVGGVQDEDYHRPEMSFMVFPNRLFRVFPK